MTKEIQQDNSFLTSDSARSSISKLFRLGTNSSCKNVVNSEVFGLFKALDNLQTGKVLDNLPTVNGVIPYSMSFSVVQWSLECGFIYSIHF